MHQAIETGKTTKLTELVANLRKLHSTRKFAEPVGKITEVTSNGYKVAGLSQFVTLGSLVKVLHSPHSYLAEVIRIDAEVVLIRPFTTNNDIKLSTEIVPAGKFSIRPCEAWKGRILNAICEAIDFGSGLPLGELAVDVLANPPSPLSRKLVKDPIKTGIKVVDVFTPLCCGQRIGIFAGSGVGKSTLLSMLGSAHSFDTIITILVGERGREVREYAEAAMENGKHRLISIVSTSDETPMMRRLAPQTGMRIAEFFRDRGENVLLIVDSITRYAHACREIALAAGEAPVARGYPPSVFTQLPQLLERAGPGLEGSGTITGVFSVLVDGDDHNDPVADSIRGTLDGHIVLKRSIAEQGRYPAVDPLSSISRLSNLAWNPDQRKLVSLLRTLVARYEDSRDLRSMGGYQKGADFELDRAMIIVPKLYSAMMQSAPGHKDADAFAELADQLSDQK